MTNKQQHYKLSDYCKGKTYVFIDAANIFYSQRTLGWRISYQKLMKLFQKEAGAQKVFVYTAYDPGNQKQKKFLDMLDINGYIVRSKPVKVISDKDSFVKNKGNLDVEMTMDVMKNLLKFTTAIFLTGDSDFAPLLQELKDTQKRVLVFSAKNHISRELFLVADKYFNLKKFKEKIELT